MIQSTATRRTFLRAVEQNGGSLEAAAAATGTPLEQHEQWMSDPTYHAAYSGILRDLEHPPPPLPPGPPEWTKPKFATLVRRKPRKPADPPPAEPQAQTAEPELAPAPPEPEPTPNPATEPPPAPKVEVADPPSQTFRGERGYIRIYERKGHKIEAPREPRVPKPKPPAEPDWTPSTEVTLAGDEHQKAMIDEYGELDRRMQLRAMDTQRYETLKRAIKTWFDQAPPDADGTVEGEVYLLHLSARERERKLRDLHEVVELIGLDKVLELATVPVGALENILGKARVAQLTIDARTGSRRIKAIAKRAVTA